MCGITGFRRHGPAPVPVNEFHPGGLHGVGCGTGGLRSAWD